jgi:hypothetical protein
MTERTLTHKGHFIVIHDNPGEIAVEIDGHPVQVFASRSRYWTPHRAYQEFASLDDLATAVAETASQPE